LSRPLAGLLKKVTTRIDPINPGLPAPKRRECPYCAARWILLKKPLKVRASFVGDVDGENPGDGSKQTGFPVLAHLESQGAALISRNRIPKI
jgi:hypothetical protein